MVFWENSPQSLAKDHVVHDENMLRTDVSKFRRMGPGPNIPEFWRSLLQLLIGAMSSYFV